MTVFHCQFNPSLRLSESAQSPQRENLGSQLMKDFGLELWSIIFSVHNQIQRDNLRQF